MYRQFIVLILLICFTVSDLKRRSIWWPAAILTAVAAGVLHAVLGDMSWQQTLYGLIPSVVLLPLAFATREAIGYGDCLTIGACGMVLGFADTAELLLLAFLFAAGVSVVLLLKRRAGRKDSFPFLPMLLAAQLCLMVPHGGK